MSVVPQEMIGLAHRLADATHVTIKHYFRRTDLQVESKDDASPVTIADKECEEIIRGILARERPQDGVLGEELGHTQSDAEWQWILDPIDGTKVFMMGRPAFGCLIGLHHKQHGFVMGLADQAIIGDRWFGAKGHGATLNGRTIRAHHQTSVKGARISITSPMRFPAPMRALHDQIKDDLQFISYGGDFLNFAGVADGSIDATFEAAQHLHDIAALIPIIEEAGGVVTEMDGTPLTMTVGSRSILAAATPELHAELLKTHRNLLA